jgi:hypothetical protein
LGIFDKKSHPENKKDLYQDIEIDLLGSDKREQQTAKNQQK